MILKFTEEEWREPFGWVPKFTFVSNVSEVSAKLDSDVECIVIQYKKGNGESNSKAVDKFAELFNDTGALIGKWDAVDPAPFMFPQPNNTAP